MSHTPKEKQGILLWCYISHTWCSELTFSVIKPIASIHLENLS